MEILNHTSLRVSWELPQNPLGTRSFEAFALAISSSKNAQNDGDKKTCKVHNDEVSCLITDLPPASTFNICVSSSNISVNASPKEQKWMLLSVPECQIARTKLPRT